MITLAGIFLSPVILLIFIYLFHSVCVASGCMSPRHSPSFLPQHGQPERNLPGTPRTSVVGILRRDDPQQPKRRATDDDGGVVCGGVSGGDIVLAGCDGDAGAGYDGDGGTGCDGGGDGGGGGGCGGCGGGCGGD